MSSDPTRRGDAPLLDRLEVIARQAACAGRPLPSEPALALELGVSRPALREALARLERAGLIRRRRGAGTIVNPGAFELAARFDEQAEFAETLAEAGYRPELDVLERTVVPLPAADAEVLHLPPGAPAVRTVKRWRADGRAVMAAIDVIPLPAGGEERLVDVAPDVGLFELVRDLRAETVEWELAWPGAIAATAAVSTWLEVPLRTAVMTLDLVGVSRSGLRCYRALEYQLPGIVRAGFVRTVRTG